MHNSVPSHSVCGTPFMDKLSLHVHRNAFYNVDCVFTTCDYMYGAIAPPSVANVSHECMHERDRHAHACAACCAPCLSSLWQRVPIPVLVQRCTHRAHCASTARHARARMWPSPCAECALGISTIYQVRPAPHSFMAALPLVIPCMDWDETVRRQLF